MRDEIRKRFDSAVLWIFRRLRYAVFPLDIAEVARRDKCGVISYEELAQENGECYEDVVKAFGNAGACSWYDQGLAKYMIAVNTSERYGASRARQRWMIAHELGHVMAGHLFEADEEGKRATRSTELKKWDDEANYFAASVLAPIPAIRALRAKRPADIRDWFGLSQRAAKYRWADLQRETVDEELADYFWCFTPWSTVKDWRRASEGGYMDRE